MSQEQEIFDEKQLAGIIRNLSEEGSKVQVSLRTEQDWIDFKDMIEKYLKELKKLPRNIKLANSISSLLSG